MRELLASIFPGIEYFDPDFSEGIQEPANFPTFDFTFMQSSSEITKKGTTGNYDTVSQLNSGSASRSMTKIRLDTSLLDTSAQNINSSSATLASITNQINSLANSAPDYDGQFASQVRQLLGGTSSSTANLSNKLCNIGSWLDNKLQQFLGVDNSFAGELGYQFIKLWLSNVSSIFRFTRFPWKFILDRLFNKEVNLTTPITGNLTDSNTTNRTSTTTELTYLSQKDPGNNKVLEVERWETKEKHIEVCNYDSTFKITNVREHIKAYGCLMTSLTMIMQDMGSTAGITDVYKGLYLAKNGESFVDALKRDGHITMFDLDYNSKMIENADKNFVSYQDNFTVDKNTEKTLDDLIFEKGGAIVVQVDKKTADNHWIVINTNENGSYTVRDPYPSDGESGTKIYENFASFQKNYSLTGKYTYISKNSSW